MKIKFKEVSITERELEIDFSEVITHHSLVEAIKSNRDAMPWKLKNISQDRLDPEDIEIVSWSYMDRMCKESIIDNCDEIGEEWIKEFFDEALRDSRSI